MDSFRRLTESLARRTTRRGLIGRSAEVATGALLGVAAGSTLRARSATAGAGTACIFPGPPCPCPGCLTNGNCAKPCNLDTFVYASGCWVEPGNIVCCDCNCHGKVPGFPTTNRCGCGSDYHNNPVNCPASAGAKK